MGRDRAGRVAAWGVGAIVVLMVSGIAIAQTYSSRARLSSSGGAAVGPNDSAAGWTSDGTTTSTTQAVTATPGPLRVGAAGISTDGGFIVTGGTINITGPISINTTQKIIGTRTDSDLTLESSTVAASSPAITLRTVATYGSTHTILTIRNATGNSAHVFRVYGSGGIAQTSEDKSGTPGAVTINYPLGRAAVAIGATSVVVTSDTVAATSNVFISPMARDATCLDPLVTTVGAGSFTVTTTGAACTAALPFSFQVFGTLAP